MSVLKQRHTGHTQRDNKDASGGPWSTLLDEFLHTGATLLTSPLVNKDAMTSVSFGLGSLHWLGRFNYSAAECGSNSDINSNKNSGPMHVGLQLVSLLGVLNFSCEGGGAGGGADGGECLMSAPRRRAIGKIPPSDLSDLCAYCGLHPSLVRLGGKMTAVARCNLLRAFLSTYDDQQLLFNTSAAAAVLGDGDATGRSMVALAARLEQQQHAEEPFVLGCCFSVILDVCNNHLPKVMW